MKAETSICTFFHGFINVETSLILFCRSLWPAILGFFRNMLILGTPKKKFFFLCGLILVYMYTIGNLDHLLLPFVIYYVILVI